MPPTTFSRPFLCGLEKCAYLCSIQVVSRAIPDQSSPTRSLSQRDICNISHARKRDLLTDNLTPMPEERTERYINPYTDFGFKALQDCVFKKLFEQAEIAKCTGLSPEEIAPL